MVTPEQLRLAARMNSRDSAMLNGAADEIERLTALLESYNSGPLAEAYQACGGKLPSENSFVYQAAAHRSYPYYYTSRLGYVCVKRRPDSIGHAICTADEYRNYAAMRRQRGNS